MSALPDIEAVLPEINYSGSVAAQPRPQRKITISERLTARVGGAIDAMVGLVSPAAGLRRVAAREMLRGYDASNSNRTIDSRSFSRMDSDSELNGKLAKMRARVREEGRNNGWVVKSKRVRTDNVIGDAEVGPGLSVEAAVIDENGQPVSETNRELDQLWDENKDNLEYTGRWGFVDLVKVLENELFESGEALAVCHDLPAPGSQLRFSVELIESDRMPTSFETVGIGPYLPLATLPNGNHVKHAIEYTSWPDRMTEEQARNAALEAGYSPASITDDVIRKFMSRPANQIVAYHILRDHPGNQYLLAPNYTTFRVPYERVIHYFEPDRAEATRGASFAVAGINTIADLRDMVENELETGRIVSRQSVHFKGKPAMPSPSGAGATVPVVDGNGRAVTYIEGAAVTYGENEPTVIGSNRPGPQFAEFVRLMGRLFGCSAGVPYPILSDDYTGFNYASLRQLHLDFRRSIRGKQGLHARHAIKRRIWPMFVRACVLARKTKTFDISDYRANPRKYTRCHVSHMQWEHMNPIQDATANAIELANGTKTLIEIPSASALRPEARLRIHAQFKKLAEELNLNLPWMVGAKGAAPDKMGVEDPLDETDADASETKLEDVDDANA